jgi:tetratricopeptide (TPR) repeat protein
MSRRHTAALLAVGLFAAQDRFAGFGRDLERESPGAHATISESGHVVWRHGAARGNRAAPVWSSQEYQGERVLWSYEPSLLIIKVPSKKLPNKQLELTVSADLKAARLEDGNVARSTIALAFLRDVAGLGDSERDELIDQALVALYRGENEKSAALTQQALDKYPELESTPDVTLLYLFAQLGLPETEASATAVIKEHPDLPAAWFYYGQYLENSKRYREAAACFEKITMHEPPWHHWTVAAAKKELTYLKTY